MSTREGLRLMVYDRTCRGRRGMPGLSHAWGLGGWASKLIGRFDAYVGVERWEDGLRFLATHAPDRPIAEVQYWGHGKWGCARMGTDKLDRRALDPGHALHPYMKDIAARLHDGDAGLWWWRTCETFGAREGHAFATELSEFLDCRVAGHTFIIGHVQSGLHTLRPGARPHWADDEGLREGTPENPLEAYWSKFWRPNTISCTRGDVPTAY